MNRKPRPSAGKYTIGRNNPVAGRAGGAAPRGHQQHQQGEHRRLRQNRQIDQRADLRLRQYLHALRMVRAGPVAGPHRRMAGPA